MSRSTRRTVLVAGGANILVAVVKFAAGLITGSGAMLSESAHSLADTLNQGFLYTSLRLGRRPPDETHPFGYGQERYFWSLLAAFGIFVAGAGFSVFEGILEIKNRSQDSDPLIAYIVLGVAFVAEGTSLLRALHQMRSEAASRDREILDHVRRSPDVTVKAALFEDTAAVIGLVFAAAGLGLTQLTGTPMWDGVASIAIGLLLVAVAFRLGRDSRDMLIGHAADPDERRQMSEEIRGTEGIDDIVDLLTMRLGPDHVLVAAKVNFSDAISAGRAEELALDIDRRLRDRMSVVPHVFLDPTHGAEQAA